MTETPRWRPYDADRDADTVPRIWREVNWIDDSDTQRDAVRTFFRGGHGLVGPAEGDAECAVHWSEGSYRWLDQDLALCAITAVTTSRVARRQRLGPDLLAEALAQGVEWGAQVAALGAFEQGYYDRFGFGTIGYEHTFNFDPATLLVPTPEQAPVRITADDHAEVFDLLQRRQRSHGAVSLHHPETMEAELAWMENPWGLGFRGDDGRLTHVVAGRAKEEYGPYTVDWIIYETPQHLLELFGAIKLLADQVQLIELTLEPAEIQVQDLLTAPNRQAQGFAIAGRAVQAHTAYAWQQSRILDLEACLGLVRWLGDPFEFDLDLTDPIADRGGRWRGIGGMYTVRVGEKSEVTPRTPGDRDFLVATVNGLSRLWTGARPASGLALTGDLSGPAELLARLDEAFRLPTPKPGLHF